jgi:tetratricopeptide (TPR) repeat protein
MTTHRCLAWDQVSNPNYQQVHYLILASSDFNESPPSAPKACFGRDGLIEKIVDLAENYTPIALIGPGGIGKTSIALAVLHDDRVRQQFGDKRWYIRCDQLNGSCVNLLGRLSEAKGVDARRIEILEDLFEFPPSQEIFIVLDNAESILDPQGMDAKEMYNTVEALGKLDGVWLCITSRTPTIPPHFETLDIPTLSIEAARDAFYRIYKNGERTDLIDNILGQLDFHPLSITLLATVADQSKWGTDRLTREWETRQTNVLQTEHNKGLGAVIELLLSSAMFQELGPDARALLEVVAFFPQGVNENNIDWLFPTIPNRADLFDKFCMLSLTNRGDGYITMLAPLRDHLSPKDPKSSSLLCTTKERYFTRMSVEIDPDKSNFGEAGWIAWEDLNVEHLLDIFTTIDPDSEGVWDACINFMRHLYWHKKRLTILRQKIEGLPDGHRSKPDCLFELSWLFDSVEDSGECRRLVTHTLKLWRERGDDNEVARVLWRLSDLLINDSVWEGRESAEEALEIYERLGNTVGQALCLINLTRLFLERGQLALGEEATSEAIDLLLGEGNQYWLRESHRILGGLYRLGNVRKANHHFELALGIATSSDCHDGVMFWIHYDLACLFLSPRTFDDAQAHTEHAKSHAVDCAYYLALVAEMQATVWYLQDRPEEAGREARRAAEIYDKFGARSMQRGGDSARHIQGN